MDRLDYYFRQKVTEAELDLGFDNAEVADRAMISDNGLIGIMSGLGVSQASPTPNVSVDVGTGVGYDQAGQRLFSNAVENVDVSVDSSSVSTDVATPGNSKIVSVFAEFVRNLSDPRIDGNSQTVFFQRDEDLTFFVKQGAESAGSPTPPGLESGRILLADITRTYGQTQILTGDIDLTSRREDAFVITGSAAGTLREGTAEAMDQAVLDEIESHVASGTGHAAASITYAGSGNWANGSPLSATDVEAAIDEIVSDLASKTAPASEGGIGLVGIEAMTATYAHVSITQGTAGAAIQELLDQLDLLWENLVDNTTPDGAAFVGAQARGNFFGSSVASFLDQLIRTVTADDGAYRIGTGNGAAGNLTAATVRQQLDELELWTSTVFDDVTPLKQTIYVDGRAGNGIENGSRLNPFTTFAQAMSYISTESLAEVEIIVGPSDYAGFTIPSGVDVTIRGAACSLYGNILNTTIGTAVTWNVSGGETLRLVELSLTAGMDVSGSIGASDTYLQCQNCTIDDTSGDAVNLSSLTGDTAKFRVRFVGDGAGVSGAMHHYLDGVGGSTDADLVELQMVDALLSKSCSSLDRFYFRDCYLSANLLTVDNQSSLNSKMFGCITTSLSLTFAAATIVEMDGVSNFYLKASGSHTNLVKSIKVDLTP